MSDGTLRDGFQELFVLTGGHKRSLRGCTAIGLVDERSQNLRKRECILSWDANCIVLWENGSIIHELKFPKSLESYISCVAYITKLNVFFGPSMDMCFNIYDQRLRLIESISHEERVVLGCYYNDEKDYMVMSGGSGVSIWRIKKCSTGSQLETSNSFLVEKVFSFDGCTEWVSKLIFEPQYNRAYALSDSTVTIVNIKTRKVECTVPDLHETPVTACIWYPIDKFYITSCMNGFVRCWFVKDTQNDHIIGNEDESEFKAVTLHAFNAHGRAVTGLSLHPRPGLLVTAGMDACIKVFDLEAFTLVQSIQTIEGITHFKMGSFFDSPMCVVAHASGTMTIWRIGSCCAEFAACSSNILKLTPFQNMNEFYSMNMSKICYDEGDILGSNIGFEHYDSKMNQTSTVSAEEVMAATAKPLICKGGTSMSTVAKETNSMADLPQYILDLDKTVQDKLPPIMSRNASEIMAEMQYDEHFKRNYSMIAFAGHDLQIISPVGSMLSRCTADLLIDGVVHYTYSVFQQLLFCIMESGALRVFCTRAPTCVLLREIYVGALTSEKASCMVLVEGMSLGPLRSSATSKDMRGEPSPLNVNEAIVIGTESGLLLCFDTFQEFALVLTQQISKSELQSVQYRPFRNELVVVARKSESSPQSTLRVFKVPDMILTHSFPCESIFVCAAISSDENYIIVGNKQGSHQLFKLFDSIEEKSIESVKRFNLELVDNDATHGRFVEILHQESDHAGSITGISICDKLAAYATSAMDCSIKFWDFKKRCLKKILLDVPSRDVLFNWPVGSLLVTQRDLLQSISYEAWKPEPRVEGDDDLDETDWNECPSEPQSAPTSAKLPNSRQTNASKPHSGVTFLTTQDEDEMAEVAFLEAALQTNGNLEEYWKKHSSVGFGGKVNGRRRARSTSKANINPGVKFDVRNPLVPVPPRRTKSRYFKRKSQKEMEARNVPPPPTIPEQLDVVHSTDDSDLSDDGDEEAFDATGCEVDSKVLDDLVSSRNPNEVRGTRAGKSLLLKTKTFMRKISQARARHATVRGSGTGDARSITFFQAVESAKARSSDSSNDSPKGSFIDKQLAKEQSNNDEVDFFMKPNGPRSQKSFLRARPTQSTSERKSLTKI